MDKIEILDQKVRTAAQVINDLRVRNAKIKADFDKLNEENQMLSAENAQVRKLIVELDRLRQERKIVRQKCEKLKEQFVRMKLT